MRTLKFMLIFATLVAPCVSFAQSDEEIMQLSISQLEVDRRAIVTSSMRLDPIAAEKFWPAYDAYRADMEPFKQKTLDLIKRYAANYGTLTNDQAATLIKDYMKLESEQLDIRKKHIKKMQKAVGDVLAMRFLQIDNKLNAIVSYGIAEQIPLAE
jgi:hypothetical protein